MRLKYENQGLITAHEIETRVGFLNADWLMLSYTSGHMICMEIGISHACLANIFSILSIIPFSISVKIVFQEY